MAELFDKIIQDGRVSFVPRSAKTRAFWTKYNSRIAGSSNAQRETVTIVPATEEEVAELFTHSDSIAPVQNKTASSPELLALREQIAAQQALIERQSLLFEKLLATSVPDSTGKESVVLNPDSKTDDKSKTQANGKGEQTKNATA